MGKSKKNTKPETETDTDTDTDTNKKTLSTKIKKTGKKTKMYALIIVVLFVLAAYMWYRNKKNKGKGVELQGVQGAQPMNSRMNPPQMNNQFQARNPIQEIQLTQQYGQQYGQQQQQ